MIVRALVTAVFLTAAVPAVAGEIKGNGKYRENIERGASICKYSGLNDEFFLGESDERTQSYGQLVRGGLKDFVPSPGVACNPAKSLGAPEE